MVGAALLLCGAKQSFALILLAFAPWFAAIPCDRAGAPSLILPSVLPLQKQTAQAGYEAPVTREVWGPECTF